ncbi:uncharacterized protein LOC127240619 isoform X2 [Andrographis paniculata]|uniref:uncharacterized protein LOC127240619 isoform X2 n=1 Tax=Andrographis paniculata TaxID=175694 RepID=UPI0021E9A2AE|nr:uncharacterized protein LOC127240619 isoform X2 [Andrographis paniculata]
MQYCTQWIPCLSNSTINKETYADYRDSAEASVDALRWEGFLIGCDKLQLYSPGEKKFLSAERKDVKISKDLIDNSWVNIEPVPDILAFLPSTMNPAQLLEIPTAPQSQSQLLDNALDEVCNGATYVSIDVLENSTNSKIAAVQDNGCGMTPDKMRQCISLGYSAKSKMANTIGQYGNGVFQCRAHQLRKRAYILIFGLIDTCKLKHAEVVDPPQLDFNLQLLKRRIPRRKKITK